MPKPKTNKGPESRAYEVSTWVDWTDQQFKQFKTGSDRDRMDWLATWLQAALGAGHSSPIIITMMPTPGETGKREGK